MKNATYAYCVVASARRPRPPRRIAGLPGAGPVRVLDVDRGLFLVVSDVALSRYGEAQIQRGLSDLDWVSKAAVAHEAVIEAFIGATAVLPMKLFTIFTSDERAVQHVRGEKARIRSLVKRLGNHHEWGLRVVLDPKRVAAAAPVKTREGTSASGVAYLTRKKAQRDATAELTAHARETVASLYDRLAARSRLARRRAASELPAGGGALLLDAAFLVPRARSQSFRALASREARSLARSGYGLTLTGPWPPYTFVQD